MAWGQLVAGRASAVAVGLAHSSSLCSSRRQPCVGVAYRHTGASTGGAWCRGSRPKHLQPPANTLQMQQHSLSTTPSPPCASPCSPAKQPAGSSSSNSSKRQRLSVRVQAAAAAEPKVMLANGLVDFYEVLGVDDDATMDEIKKAYRSLAKECHPDYLGDEGHNICILLNEAYEVLSNEDARANYNAQLEVALQDEEDDYTGEPLSKWVPGSNPAMAKNEDPAENRAVFVDEVTCIGCKQCVWHASACFRMEPEYGRSRVFAQWLNTEDELQAAIDSCPVSCIHWVQKEELPALEYVMQNRVDRVNVGVMMAGQGRPADVFAATASFIKERKRKEEEALRAKRKYSPAQEEARRAATDALLKEHLGFFANFVKAAVNEVISTVEGNGEGVRVGRRQRAQRWYERGGSAGPSPQRSLEDVSGDYYMVPPERALVPVTVYAQRKDD